MYSFKRGKYLLLSLFFIPLIAQVKHSRVLNDIGKGKRNVTFRVEEDKEGETEKEREKRCT